MAPYDAVTNPLGGAAWAVPGCQRPQRRGRSPALPESWIQDFGDIQVGFVGAVTDHLPELVSPAGIEGLKIEAPVVAANRDRRRAEGTGRRHRRAARARGCRDHCARLGDRPGIGLRPDRQRRRRQHRRHHLRSHPPGLQPPRSRSQQWIDQGRRGHQDRPVVSAGQYGYNLNQLLFTVEPESGQVSAVSQNTAAADHSSRRSAVTTRRPPNYPADPAVGRDRRRLPATMRTCSALCASARSAARSTARSWRNGTTENRGGESTLGNLVAEVQREQADDTAEFDSADRVHEPRRSACRTWSASPARPPPIPPR